MRCFTWEGTDELLSFSNTLLCSIVLNRAFGANVEILKEIIDSVATKALAQDVKTLFPISSKEDLKTVESYVPHIKLKMVSLL